MAAEAKFYLRVNWRGKLMIAVMKTALSLNALGLKRSAQQLALRSMKLAERRNDWFDVSSRPWS